MEPAAAVFLGLGANEGDREGNLRRALKALAATPGIEVDGASALVETEPLGGSAPQAMFLNGVARLRTSLSAPALLAVCKALERAAGRVLPAPRMAPRPLDLDILLYGDERIDTRELTVPHVALWERSFWRQGLAELGLDVDSVTAWERPIVLEEPLRLAAQCARWVEGGCVVGLVPTMGALHEGHATLIRRARRECDRVVVTIFVNPLQFGEGEDFDSYPRTLDSDLAVLRQEGVDAVFAPPPAAMYPEGFCSRVAVGREAEGLEGATRPGHFEGVATVVARLFALARPHRAYFGQKDAQQVAVLRRMNADLGFGIELVECAIDREADGLARSSRNVHLSAEDRRAASVLYRALRAGRAAYEGGERVAEQIVSAARRVLDTEPRCAVDYLELRLEPTLAPLVGAELGDGPRAGRLVVAAWFGPEGRRTRLIDNMSVSPPAGPS